MNLNKLKVMSIVGTRPEIIRLSMVLNAFDESEAIDHISVHTGQNYDYELNEVFYSDLEIRKPDYFLEAAGSTAIETIGKILIKIEPVIKKVKPDAVLILGDTNSCLCAIPAKKMKIPVFHMEAGNRCFDQIVPEEINRKIVDHVADINLTYSDIAREYLLKEGLDPDKIIKTGSPMFEVLNNFLPKIKRSKILKNLNLKKDNYFLISTHREENVSNKSNFRELLNTLNEISKKYKKQIIISTHPRTRKELEKLYKESPKDKLISQIKSNPLINWLKPLSFTDYNYLQINSLITISDSGTINEESSILGFKSLNLRENHERPEGMEEAASILVGINFKTVDLGISHLLTNDNQKSRLVQDYSMPNVSEKLVRIIISYTHYINRKVWKKKI